MSTIPKPAYRTYLEWYEVRNYYEARYPVDFDEEAIAAHFLETREIRNGKLLMIDCILPGDIPESRTEPPAMLWFMNQLPKDFPDAVSKYGAVHLHYFW